MTRKLPHLNALKPYQSTLPFKNGHFDTIIPALFRKNHHVKYERFRIITRDDDFLDLDFSVNKNKKNSKLIILSHGLESSSDANYIKGMIKLFEKDDFDALAWNCRGCSGEANLKEFYYHSGFTQDLDEVINYALNVDQYLEIYLIGFSMGGNLTLKYLGEKSKHISSKIKRACVFSTPCDLASASHELKKGASKIYTLNFLITLKRKIKSKQELYKKMNFKTDKILQAKTLPEFDEHFTAKINGFKDANDYYQKSSSLQFFKDITIPTLIVNAKNDPFLGEDCYPHKEVEKNKFITLETPDSGGHCGFYTNSKDNTYWSELRALHFFNS